MTPDRHRHPERLPAAIGITLLLTSQLTDSLEPYLGISALNLYFALSFAVLALALAALTGDALIRLLGWHFDPTLRRGAPTAILAAAGTGVAAVVLICHLDREIALDAWLALVGSTLLLLAAAIRLGWPARLRATRGRGHATIGRRLTAPNAVRERTSSVEHRQPAHRFDHRIRRWHRSRTPSAT
jgi:hypothetical protein